MIDNNYVKKILESTEMLDSQFGIFTQHLKLMDAQISKMPDGSMKSELVGLRKEMDSAIKTEDTDKLQAIQEKAIKIQMKHAS